MFTCILHVQYRLKDWQPVNTCMFVEVNDEQNMSSHIIHACKYESVLHMIDTQFAVHMHIFKE